MATVKFMVQPFNLRRGRFHPISLDATCVLRSVERVQSKDIYGNHWQPALTEWMLEKVASLELHDTSRLVGHIFCDQARPVHNTKIWTQETVSPPYDDKWVAIPDSCPSLRTNKLKLAQRRKLQQDRNGDGTCLSNNTCPGNSWPVSARFLFVCGVLLRCLSILVQLLTALNSTTRVWLSHQAWVRGARQPSLPSLPPQHTVPSGVRNPWQAPKFGCRPKCGMENWMLTG